MANSKSKKSGRTILFSVLVVLILGGSGFGYWYKKREKPIVVQTDKAVRRNLVETVVATGKVQPVLQVAISPEVPGEIVELPVKEGQMVQKGDLLLRIKPDIYVANVTSAEATFKSALANIDLSKANLEKAKSEYERISQLYNNKLLAESDFVSAKTSMEVAQASYESSKHQANQLKAVVKSRQDELAKTTIVAPIAGTVTKLKSELGERVVGSSMMQGTEIMTVANLTEMEARVEINEVDIVLIKIGQKATLEVDSFKDRKFKGVVTEIANAAKTSAMASQQESTKFEVKIRIQDKETFRPGMSVTAEVETQYRTNVLAIPIQCVTTRIPGAYDPKNKDNNKKKPAPKKEEEEEGLTVEKKKNPNAPKPVEVAFGLQGDRARMIKVKRGISDNTHVEIEDGLKEGDVIISGGYKAINRELEEGKLIKVDNEKKIGPPTGSPN